MSFSPHRGQLGQWNPAAPALLRIMLPSKGMAMLGVASSAVLVLGSAFSHLYNLIKMREEPLSKFTGTAYWSAPNKGPVRISVGLIAVSPSLHPAGAACAMRGNSTCHIRVWLYRAS